MNTYFITGATGAIGAALVPLLLKEKDTELFLLIRAENKGNLVERLGKLFDFWGFREDDEKRGRIKAVAGDVKEPYLGMDRDIYQKLSERCTHIVHCAGNVRMNLPLEEARSCSVGSARHIMELGKICKANNHLKKIEFVSTVGVGGRMQGVVPETWLTLKREFHNTYEQAKAEAEDFIKSYADEGFPITVHRPSMVVGDSKTGKIIHFQIFYHLCEFLSGGRTLGITPDTGTTRLDIIPSEYVAEVIAWSSKTEKTRGKILHECSGPDQAILVSELKKRVQEIFSGHGERLPKPFSIPVWLFKSILPVIGLFVSKPAARAMKALPVFFDYLATTQGFGNEQTRDGLKEAGIEFPGIDDYLETVVNKYLEYKRTKQAA
jgi:thioester reductase-like protein